MDNIGSLQRNFTQGSFYFSQFLKASTGFVVGKYVSACPVLGKNLSSGESSNCVLAISLKERLLSSIYCLFLSLIFRKGSLKECQYAHHSGEQQIIS